VNLIRNKEYIKAFGQRLFKLRLESSLSQEQLAHKADIPVNQIGRIERGEINTTISTVYAISQALKIVPKDLFDF
jgi:transcriptional regulator with XRE-family HTH domain